jgi:hypothetical protein
VTKTAEAAAPPATAPVAGAAAVILAYAATIFFSAFLLFQVQPLISKFILPWFGGSPAVWTAAMLFFQVVLFGGYLYAHLTSSHLSARGQFLLHATLLLAATAVALATYISPGESFKPTGDEGESPLLKILILLTATVGLPYFVLSSTGPLLQKWFSDAFEGRSPYRLFALSNLGSLLALLSYPFFFEVRFDSQQQGMIWSLAFAFFAACCAFCAWWTYQARVGEDVGPAQRQAKVETREEAPPSVWRWSAWIGLPALASIMFLAVTNEVCQNLATIPLLWIIPLSLYLLSFIVAFDHPRWYSRPVYGVATLISLAYLATFNDTSRWLEYAIEGAVNRFQRSGEEPFLIYIRSNMLVEDAVYFVSLFLVCMICHCELVRLKPTPQRLTAFFLTMALGGAVGGIVVNLVCMYLFTTFFELPLAMAASAVLATGTTFVAFRERNQRELAGVGLAFGIQAIVIIAVTQLGIDWWTKPNANRQVMYRARNFYGLVSVEHDDIELADKQEDFYNFRSGYIVHGRQWAHPDKRGTTEIAYWGPGTGCRRAIEFKQQQGECRIGVVGLGIGTIAGFARSGDYVRMYEINPEVVKIAQNPPFYFLADCQGRQDIVVGDARLQLERELKADPKGNQFDVLCLDAFSGDAVPTHLLTAEAFVLYKQHLKPDGIIVVNITNTYLDLYPVVTQLAAANDLQHTRIFKKKQPQQLQYRTYFVLVTNDKQFLAANPEDMADAHESGQEFLQERTAPLWTDRYHSLWHVLQ